MRIVGVPIGANDPARYLTGRSGFGRDQENLRNLRDSHMGASSPIVVQLAEAPTERHVLCASERLVAKYADACNLFGSSVADVSHKLDVLRGHCDAEGRDYDAIEKTIVGRVDPEGDVSDFLSEMEEYARLGVDLVEVAPAMPDPVRFVTLLGEKVVRPLAEIG